MSVIDFVVEGTALTTDIAVNMPCCAVLVLSQLILCIGELNEPRLYEYQW